MGFFRKSQEEKDEKLINSAAAGDISKVISALKSGANPNTSMGNGNTPLILASRNGHTEVVRELLQVPDIDVNAKGESGIMALPEASKNGCLEIVNLLLAHPDIDVNGMGRYDHNPALTEAAVNHNTSIVIALLGHPKIDVNIKQGDEETALERAAYVGATDIVKELLKRPEIDVNSKPSRSFGNTALMWTMNGNQELEMAKDLLAHPNIDVNSKNYEGDTPLMRSVMGYDEIFKMLISHPKIDVNIQNNHGDTALGHAISNGHLDRAKDLLSMPEINPNGKSYDRWAENNKDNGSSPLISAINGMFSPKYASGYNFNKNDAPKPDDYREVIQKILDTKGLDINAQSNAGETALTILSRTQEGQLLEKVLNHPEIDANIQNKDGNSALIIATEQNNIFAVKRLLEVPDIDADLKNENGQTAQDIADIKGLTKISDLIESHVPAIPSIKVSQKSIIIPDDTTKTELLKPDSSGSTLLHAAIEAGKFGDVIDSLNKNGEKLSKEDILDNSIHLTMGKNRQLASLFTKEVWEGRPRDMQQVWDRVHPSHKKQVPEFGKVLSEINASMDDTSKRVSSSFEIQ